METYTLSEPEKIPVSPPGETPPPPPVMKHKRIIISVVIGAGFLVMFLLGMLMSSLARPQQQMVENSTPTPTATVVKVTPNPSEVPPEINTSIRFLPGKQYLDDSIAIITKSEPKKALLISVSRFEQEKNYTQYVKVNYYDGTTWARETITTTGPDSKIVTTPLLSGWTLRSGPISSEKDSSSVQIRIDNKPVTFSLSRLSPDISTRALPGFTKFSYFGTGSLVTGEEKADAYIAYTQSYSQNSSDVLYLNSPERLESTWLVFWDTEGNAYQLESLSSNQKSIPYENFSSAIILQANGSVMKPSTYAIRNDPRTGQYTTTMSTNPPLSLQFALVAPLEKSPVKTYTWQSALTTGNIVIDKKIIPGVGLFESIGKTK